MNQPGVVRKHKSSTFHWHPCPYCTARHPCKFLVCPNVYADIECVECYWERNPLPQRAAK